MTTKKTTKKTTKARKTAAKKPLNDKKQVDGRYYPESDPLFGKTLDDIWGVNKYSQNLWKAESKEDFEGRLDKMNLADMQSLATKVGIIPQYDRQRLKATLTREFTKQNAARRNYLSSERTRNTGNLDPSEIKRVKDILRR